MNFVELAGSEQSVATETRDTAIKQFVTKSFNSLSAELLRSALGKGNQERSLLVDCLKPTLCDKSEILLITCANSSTTGYHHTLPSVKFCAKIRDSIVKRLERREAKKYNTSKKEVGLKDKLDQIIKDAKQFEQHGPKDTEQCRVWCMQTLEYLQMLPINHDFKKAVKEAGQRVKALLR
jgi:hypothetical protein